MDTKLPSFIKVITKRGESFIFIESFSSQDAGSFRFQVLATDPNSGLKDNSVDFFVRMECKVTSLTLVQTKLTTLATTYEVGSQSQSFELPEYEIVPKYCHSNLKYYLQQYDGEKALPAFISLQEIDKKIVIESKDFSLKNKKYTFKVLAKETDNGAFNEDYQFVVDVKVDNSPPVFTEPLVD